MGGCEGVWVAGWGCGGLMVSICTHACTGTCITWACDPAGVKKEGTNIS